MTSAFAPRVPGIEEAARIAPEQVVDLVRSQVALREEVETLKHQLDWFKRQLFGQNSERRIVDDSSTQMNLGEALDVEQRRRRRRRTRATTAYRSSTRHG